MKIKNAYTSGWSRRGFTFTEVLFAIIILGIGFIMLAGMFPIAIQQTQTTLQETAGSTVGPAAVKLLEPVLTRQTALVTYGAYLPLWGPPLAIPTNTTPPPAPQSATAYPSLQERLRGNQILTTDPRFGWTALYRRLDEFTNTAQVIIFICQARNPYYGLSATGITLSQELPHYDSTDVFRFLVGIPTTATVVPNTYMANLEPRPVHVILSYGGAYETTGTNNPSIVEFFTPPNTTWPPFYKADADFRDLIVNGAVTRTGAVAEGCYLVISNDNVSDNGQTYVVESGLRNGSIFRIGRRRSDLDGKINANNTQVYELIPGDDLRSLDENIPPHPPANTNFSYNNHNSTTPARAFIVGRGFTKPKPVGTGTNPAGSDLTFSGPPMDIGVYRAVIQLK